MAGRDELKPGNVTVLGAETEFSGELKFTDNLVINGTFAGTITSGGHLEIAKSAVCSVDSIKTESIVIFGQVIGNIEAPERIEMKSGCKITGDIVTDRLRIADNVDFHGQVTMIERNVDVPQDIFALSTEEYKHMLQRVTDHQAVGSTLEERNG